MSGRKHPVEKMGRKQGLGAAHSGDTDTHSRPFFSSLNFISPPYLMQRWPHSTPGGQAAAAPHMCEDDDPQKSVVAGQCNHDPSPDPSRLPLHSPYSPSPLPTFDHDPGQFIRDLGAVRKLHAVDARLPPLDRVALDAGHPVAVTVEHELLGSGERGGPFRRDSLGSLQTD